MIMKVIWPSRTQSYLMSYRLRSEGVTEVWVEQFAIVISVEASDEHVDQLFVCIVPKIWKQRINFWGGDTTLVLSVKHLESIHQVEVWS